MVALISQEVSRGTQLDALIPARLNGAIRWIEGEYNLSYMNRLVEATLVTDCRVVLLPSRPKTIEFLRLVDNGAYNYLTKVDPVQVSAAESATPTGYWVDGIQYIRFDNAPGADQEFELYYAQFTEELSGTDEHWLFDNARFFLVYAAMVYMAGPMRDTAIASLYKAFRDEQLHSVTLADEAFKQSNSDPRMRYSGGSS